MRIIQISDLHFGFHNPLIIEPFLKDLSQLKPDLILISGDLTQRAKISQFKSLKIFLDCLPVPLLIVPGNHDIPLHNLFLRLLNPFKHYKHYVSPHLDMSFSNKEVNILGVNSVTPLKIKDGKLPKKTIQRIKSHFSKDSGQLNILFFHHNLNYFSGMHHPLNNAEEFINYLKESPIHIVCTGHLHYCTVKVITKNKHGNCIILHAGSLLCRRGKDKLNSFYVIDTQQLTCRIDWRVFVKDVFSSHETYDFNFSE